MAFTLYDRRCVGVSPAAGFDGRITEKRPRPQEYAPCAVECVCVCVSVKIAGYPKKWVK